ncbi:MAG: 50S ribosomal protein L29 [Candidatus Latescibacteria bacterium]|nr:50S ribosomal protein L29 [Candidatus Latescibacterota bacterium]
MKASEIRNMTRDEIVKNIADLRDEHFKLRMRRSAEEIPNPLRLRMIKKDIARLQTILKEFDTKSGADIMSVPQEKEKKTK